MSSLAAQLVKNPPAMRETWVRSLSWKDPLEKGKATHSSILAWRIPWTTIHGVSKSQTRLSNFHLHFQTFKYTLIGEVSFWLFAIFNMLSRVVIAFFPRRKHLLVSWLQSLSAVILEPRKIKYAAINIQLGEGNGTPLQYSCRENPMDGGAW